MSLLRFAFRPALAATLLASALLAAGAQAATVVEYTNRNDFPHSPGGQFFYSADPAEQATVDLGAAGSFYRTGRTFLTGGTTPVCRFYGSVTPGPNSHFFTVDPDECNVLKSAQVVPTPTTVQQWNFERNEYLTTPTALVNNTRTCPAGTTPVLRAYNNAFPLTGPRNPWDSNHRFVRGAADIDSVVAQGWRAEGTVFCVPASSTVRAFAAESFLSNHCVAPRADPQYGDGPGTPTSEMAWVRSYVDETYLWYADVPDRHPADYPSPETFFLSLKTPAKSASGRDLDRFHFFYPTDQWEALTQGTEFGYGWQLAALSTTPPRQFFIAFSEPTSPAGLANVVRGAKILEVDGVDLVNGGNTAALNAGLFPATAGEMHTFKILDANATTPRTVTLISGQVAIDPVPTVRTIDVAGGGKVGYIAFHDHNLPAEGRLITAINQLKAANIQDLFLDLRYNGGGYLYIASQMGYMIAGPARTNNKLFEKLTFSDKRSADTNDPGNEYPFFSTTSGLSGTNTTPNVPLPTLNLGRVFVLTSGDTASASESIINSLQGIGVQVIRVGSATYGKPYGFSPRDNCGVTYFSVEFKGTNQAGFGDYDDGFAPTCQVADDFNHQLGDSTEGRLAVALNYRATGSCTIAGAASMAKSATPDPRVLRSPARENRILLRPSTATAH